MIAVVLTSAAARFVASRGLDAPWIAPDETVYALLGRSLWSSGSMSLLGAASGFRSPVYPALTGAALSLAGPVGGLAVTQAVQAVLMSSAALIVWAWCRNLVGTGWALLAAVLTVVIPGLAYTGLLMTESMFYPLVTVALWALWGVLAHPSLARQAMLVAAVALAMLTRLQAVALIPAIALAIALHVLFTRDRRTLRKLAPLGALVVGICLAAGVFTITDSWRNVFGAYAAAVGGYELGPAAKAVAWHAGGAFILVAGIPLIALGILAVGCVRGRERDASASALVATATAWTVAVVVQVGVFASRWVGHIAERDMLTIAPPLFAVFALWLSRGAPRPQPTSSIVALALAAPAVLMPVERFATQLTALDAFTFIPLWRLAETSSPDVLELTFVVGVALLATVAVLVPLRARVILPVIVGCLLATASVVSSRQITRLASADRTWVFAEADPRWIDRNAAGAVTYVHAETTIAAAVWKTLYWNEHIDEVVRFDDTPAVGTIPERLVSPNAAGIVRDTAGHRLRGPYAVAPSNIALVGTSLASYGPATDLPGLTLWRTDTPLRVRSMTTGVQPNGDIVGSARIAVLGCGRGRLELTLIGKDGAPVEIATDGRRVLRIPLARGSAWVGSVSSPRGADGRTPCHFAVTPGAYVGSTRIEFVAD